MSIATGTVVDGRIVLEGVSLREGDVVTVVIPESETDFELADWQYAELQAAMEEIERGDFLTPEQLFARLPTRD